MITPRLALAALLCFAASAAMAGEVTWTKVQPGESWTSVTFESESKTRKTYWFRSDATGDNVPLYILTLKPNPSVKNSSYFESVPAGYTMKIVPSPRSYVVARPNTGLTFAGRPSGNLGGAAWAETHKGQPYRGGVTVVVAAPTAEAEKLAPTPISVFTPGLADVNWDDYYYIKEPETSIYNPWGAAAQYRDTRKLYYDIHARVLPFEYLIDKDQCFVRPESCADPKKKEHAPYIEAAAQAAEGNLLLIEPLAVQSHKYYAGKAREFKAELEKAPADAFTVPENKLLEAILKDNKQFAAFQTELAGLKPDQQPKFVTKWRSYLKAEIDHYLADAEKAGSKPVPQMTIRKAMAARLTAAAKLPLGAVVAPPVNAGKPGGKPDGKPAGPKPEPPPAKKPDVASTWRDKVTGVGSWHAVKTSAMPLLFNITVPLPGLEFYCYHHNMSGDKSLTVHLKKFPATVECVNWIAPNGDATQTNEKKEQFKVRGTQVQFDIALVDGKLTVVKGIAGVTVTELARDKWADKLGGLGFVKATSPSAPVKVTLPLSVAEKTWLDKTEASQYTSTLPPDAAKVEAHVDAFRAKIVVNMEDRAASYQNLIKDLKAEIKPTDLPAMWGAPEPEPKTIVGPFGVRTEIQLSKEEYDALEALDKPKPADPKAPAKPAAPVAAPAADTKAQLYVKARYGSDGKGAGGAYDSLLYDPIKLRRSVVAARKLLNKGPNGEAPKVEPKPRAVLTDAEIALLTPEEKRMYEGFLERAKKGGKVDPTDNNLLTNAELLRNRMNSEKPPRSEAAAMPSSADMTAQQFNAMPLWQKRKFCVDYPVDAAVIANDKQAPTLDNATADALKGAGNSVGNGPKGGPAGKSAPAATDTKWPKKARQDACRKLPPEIPGEIDPTPKGPGKEPAVAANIVGGNGVDVETPKKKPNEWLTGPLVGDAIKGGFLGLVIGSLFGPIGLIAGPLIGAAIFYGVGSPLMKKKDD